MMEKVPELRFPEFSGAWKTDRIDQFIKRTSLPVEVDKKVAYQEIGVRSHGKGVFHKVPVTGAVIGDKPLVSQR